MVLTRRFSSSSSCLSCSVLSLDRNLGLLLRVGLGLCLRCRRSRDLIRRSILLRSLDTRRSRERLFLRRSLDLDRVLIPLSLEEELGDLFCSLDADLSLFSFDEDLFFLSPPFLSPDLDLLLRFSLDFSLDLLLLFVLSGVLDRLDFDSDLVFSFD